MNGQSVKSWYTVVLPIFLDNGKIIRHEFEVIKDLLYPALLGTDFLKSYQAKIDFATNILQIGNFKAKFEIPEVD